MNADELRELAKTLIGIADGQPWQFSSGNNKWTDALNIADPITCLETDWEIRLKPWELGRSINGHTLPEGASWHRQDFAEDMLPAPYRPMVLGEVSSSRDCQVFSANGFCTLAYGEVITGRSSFCRTARPIPFMLTKEQIADGWVLWSGGECPVEPESQPMVMFRSERTLQVLSGAKAMAWDHSDSGGDIIAYRPDPYGKFRQALSDGKEIEHQANVGGQWYSLINAMEVDFMSPPEAYRIKPEPQWLPLGPEDVAPFSVVRHPDWMVHGWRYFEVIPSGVILISAPENRIVHFDELKRDGWLINRPRHRDADGNPTLWKECRKEAK